MQLPNNIQLIERGWLSANTILLCDARATTAIDTGYCSHSAQTVALLNNALGDRRLDRIINTHLHSDHCGGNAALIAQHGCEVLIPPGEAPAVATWDSAALSYDATGQECPRFMYTGLVQAGDMLHMGATEWQALAAPGHDPASLIFYCPQHELLISADALWENGFGVVFPELDGEHAFDEVAATLDLIERLRVRVVLPGHGGAFSDVNDAIYRARKRLDSFVKDPVKHRWHAVKVLCMFWLMAAQSANRQSALAHLSGTRYIIQVADTLGLSGLHAVQQALDEMLAKKQIKLDNNTYSAA